MSEQVFRSPGFFEREVDLTQRNVTIEGIPAGVIGTSTYGPAFVPVTVGSFLDFEKKFGTLDKDQFGPFAVREWLKNRRAATFIRVLGAGIGSQTNDGTVENAGFIIKGSTSHADDLRHQGSVQFIAALHDSNSNELAGYPLFTDNQSFDSANNLKLIRGMVLLASGARLQILDNDEFYTNSNVANDDAKISDYDGKATQGTFKLILSSALGSTFGNDESQAGVRIHTASLDPNSSFYIGKFLNKNPDRFHEEQHLLYGEFPIEDELARVEYHASNSTVALLSGSSDSYRNLFGRFDTRYQTARTTSFISQPFGSKEYDLFHFESLDDGSIGNKRVKVSISNLRKSSDPKNPYGTFNVLIRDYNDTDTSIRVLETFGPCTLNPADENYVANKIGDYRVKFNFDAVDDSERRLDVEGKRPNRSQFIRIIMNDLVENKLIPPETLPFGFRGLPVIKTNDMLTDNTESLAEGSSKYRLGAVESSNVAAGYSLTGSILPPVPMRFKSTRGAVDSSAPFTGKSGAAESSDARFFWGVKTEALSPTGSISNSVLKSNIGAVKNNLIDNYVKLLGIQGLDAVVTGSGADAFNNNKFTLAKVALYNQFNLTDKINSAESLISIITGSASEHIKDAAYIRNGSNETKNYTISESSLNRLTFASLAAARESKYFNRFTDYAKFTNVLYGGFDGVNILDRDQRLLNDRAASSEAGGKAAGEAISYLNLHADSDPGSGENNNIINSYRTAGRILTDPLASRVNIVTVPGIRDPYVTDYVGDLTRDYSQAIYLMDIPSYSDIDSNGNSTRIFGTSTRPNVQKTVDAFDGRGLDNNYVATYFPDVVVDDDINRSTVEIPSSIAALKALGYNDAVAFPWFAPAGFNRGALNNVLNSKVRLNTEDRNVLYEARINPIATFPNGGFVIFGQKTLQQDKSALDRVNVRRMLLEVKRIVSDIATKLIFEQNTPATRARFIADVTPELATIQANQGIDQFKVIMDSTNNNDEDVQQNRLNGRIVLVPTRAVEFIAIDFIITNSGVSFE